MKVAQFTTTVHVVSYRCVLRAWEQDYYMQYKSLYRVHVETGCKVELDGSARNTMHATTEN